MRGQNKSLGKGLAWKGLLLLAALWALAVVLSARPGDRALYPAQADGINIYVLNNGFHTDIALPADLVMARGGILAQAGRSVGDKRWLIYGWGDAGFYTGQGVSLVRVGDGLRALFKPGNPSVIRVFGVNSSPDAAFVDPIAAPAIVSRDGFEAMARHIEASFTTRDGAPILDPVATPGNPFFTSHEHFSVVRLCNNWTSDQLSAAGLPTAPMIDGLAPLLALDLNLRAGVRRK